MFFGPIPNPSKERPVSTFYLIFVLLPLLDLFTHVHNPRKARQRAILSLSLLALWFLGTLFFASEAQAALSEPANQFCDWKVPFCAFGSILQLPMYLFAFLVLVTIATSLIGALYPNPLWDKLIAYLRQLKPSTLLVVFMVIVVSLLLGNTLICYYLS